MFANICEYSEKIMQNAINQIGNQLVETLRNIFIGLPKSPHLMPPSSWVELALAGLAEARCHDGRGHRESLLSKLRCIFAYMFDNLPQKHTYYKNAFLNSTTRCDEGLGQGTPFSHREKGSAHM